MTELAKPTGLMRLLVAAGVVVGTTACGRTFGHAHAHGDGHHVHSGWGHHYEAEVLDDHGHFHAMAESLETDDSGLRLAAGASTFHLHTTLLGIPISLPVPADPDEERNTYDPVPIGGGYSVSASAEWWFLSRNHERIGYGEIPRMAAISCSGSHAPPVDGRAMASDSLLYYPCALQVYSCVLRL
jgi:hypothetical protein